MAYRRLTRLEARKGTGIGGLNDNLRLTDDKQPTKQDFRV